MQSPSDITIEVLGPWGAWQRRAVFLIYLCKIPSAWFMACIIFTAPTPRPGEFFCSPLGDGFAPSVDSTNRQIDIEMDFCRTDGDFNGTSYQCESFEHSTDFVTLVTQFDLVCSKTILIAVTQFFHLFGVLTGGILATKLLLIQSPRYVMLFGMVTQIICGCITGLTSQFGIHMFFRFLSAVCCAQMFTAGQMIFTDITGGKYRTTAVCLFETFWSLGVIVLPLLALICPDWSNLYLLISLPTVLYIGLWFLIPDSPRWFMKMGRLEEAKAVLFDGVRYNGGDQSVPKDFEDRLIRECTSSDKAALSIAPSWWSIWKGAKAARTVIAVHVAWAVYVTNYNGMLLNVKAYGRDQLSYNTIIFGISEIVGVLIGLTLILKTERKWLWTGVFNILAGVISYTGFWLPNLIPLTFPTNVILMLTAAFAKVAVSTSQSMLFTCSGEVVAPEKRPIFLFSCVVWARICLLSAPFVGALVGFEQTLPLATFGTMSLFGGIATALIPRPSQR